MVRGFLVTFTPGRIGIGGVPCDAIVLTFINQTGSVVYLRNALLKEVKKNFPVPAAASRDMASAWRELVFAIPPDTHHNTYQCILQTNERVIRRLQQIAP